MQTQTRSGIAAVILVNAIGECTASLRYQCLQGSVYVQPDAHVDEAVDAAPSEVMCLHLPL